MYVCFKRRLSAILLVSSLIFPLFSSTALAVHDEEREAEESEKLVLPEIISREEAEELGLKARAYDKESNLFSFVFDNYDGTGTMKVFMHPVKYLDENGDIKDITLNLESTDDGGYKTADNSIISSFPQKLSDGIGISSGEISVKMKPVTENEVYAEANDELKKVIYKIDENTSYEYQLTYTGYKENIVVTQYTGQTEYDFILNTGGLELYEDNDGYSLKDSEGNSAVRISEIIIYSADGKNNTLGSMTYETIKEKEEYLLTIHISEDYLNDDKTVYPIIIDPSITINYQSSGASINTANVCSGYNYVDNESNYLFVGKRTNKGKSRFLMSFQQLDLSSIHSSACVNGAYVRLSETSAPSGYSHYSSEMNVYCYMFNGSWTPSVVTWNNANLASNTYTYLGSKTVSDAITSSNNNEYKFYITTAVKRWVDAKDIPTSYNVFRPYKGLVFKSASSVETGANELFKVFASPSQGTVLSPSLTINFTYSITRNEFFTKFDPVKYNTNIYIDPNNISNQSTDLYRYRTNCYGYALGLLHKDSYYPPTELKQRPGYFSDNPCSGGYSSSSEMLSVYSNKISNDIAAFNNEFGCDYTIEEYALPNGTTTVGQFGTNERLIALVVYYDTNSGSGRYHFYMQHSDGTWSHKDGYENVSNVSFPDAQNNSKILTNDNIVTYSRKGLYSNGLVKFFKITKSHAHLCHGANESLIGAYFDDGDYLENPTIINNTVSNKESHIVFANDEDVYYLQNVSTRQYRIRAFVDPDFGTNFDLTVKLCSSTGTLMVTHSYETPIDFYYNLSGGNQYYIIIYDHMINNTQTFSDTPLEYYLTIT